MREVTITPAAAQAARRAGIFGNVAARITRMARRSAPVTHEAGNRRFQDYILAIERGEVRDVIRMDGIRMDVITVDS